MSTNPLLDQSMLPYQAPRFDRIKDCHYRPAFDEGVRQKRVEIEAIVNHPAAPDFYEYASGAGAKRGASVTRHQRFFRDDGRAH